MLSRLVPTSVFAFVAILLLGCTTWAQSIEVGATSTLTPTTQTLTITIKGTIGPILSGSDPLGFDGKSGMVTVLASESLSPTSHTTTSATYTLPAGAIKVSEGTNKFTTKSPSKMIINLASTADTLTLIASGPNGLLITDKTFLKAGSWTTAILKHPGVFKPSPQTLTSAKTATGPGCKVKYTIFTTTTVLGFHGTGASSAATDPVLPDDDDLDQ